MGMSQFAKQELSRLAEENAQLQEQADALRRHLEAVQILSDAAASLYPSEDVAGMFDSILYTALAITGGVAGAVVILDEQSGDLVFAMTRGIVGEPLDGRRIAGDHGTAGWVVANNQPVLLNNPRVDDRYLAGDESALVLPLTSLLAAPITSSERVIGALEVMDRHDDLPFTETDQALLVVWCRFAGEVLQVILRADAESGAADY